MQVGALVRQLERAARASLSDACLELMLDLNGRVLLFLDGYELLQRNLEPDFRHWLWGLLERAHQLNLAVRVVVGSREPLRYAPGGGKWPSQVDPFTRPDCDSFLDAWGVADPALRAAIFELTGGHPLPSRMAAELYHASYDKLTVTEIRQGVMSQRAPEEWLYGRILDRLPESLHAAARHGALLRRFNMKTLNALLPAGAPQLEESLYRQLVSYSFVVWRGKMQACHDLIRQAQSNWMQRERPGRLADFHRAAHAHFQAVWEAEGDWAAQLDALYHHLRAEPNAGFAAWEQAFREAARYWRLAQAGQLLHLAQEQQEVLLPEAALWLTYHAGYLAYQLAEWERALVLLQPLLEQALPDKLQARTLNLVGRCLNSQGERVLDHYQQSWETFERIGDQASAATLCWNIGLLLEKQGKPAEAPPYLERTVEIHERIGHPNAAQSQANLERLRKKKRKPKSSLLSWLRRRKP